METSLDYYKSKYEEFNKLNAKKAELERIIQDLRSKSESLEHKSSKQSSKILKYKDRLSSLKARFLDAELEIAKKNTENDVLRVEKEETLKKLSKMEAMLNERTHQLSQMPQFSESDLHEGSKANLKAEIGDSLMSSQLTFGDRPKKDSEHTDALRKISGDSVEDLEGLKGDNEILMQKCKKLTQDNEINRGVIGKLESQLKRLQSEKEELAAQVKCLINKETDIESSCEDKVEF